MGRKNRRIVYDTSLPPIKDEFRPPPKCWLFPEKTVFTTAIRAQTAIDEIRYRSDRDKTPVRVYDCLESEGGCGFYHITSQEEYQPHYGE